MTNGVYLLADRIVFGEMLRDFPPCIQKLRENRCSLRAGRSLLRYPLKIERATELRIACSIIYSFNNQHWRNTSTPERRHIRNEMKNLIRFEQNLYPQESFVGGFTHLNTTQGPLIKWFREETDDVVVVSEKAWQTECVVCFQRERDVVLYPCKHFCLCRECRYSVHTCPICRAPIRTDRPFGDVLRDKLPYIQSIQFPGFREYTRRMLI